MAADKATTDVCVEVAPGSHFGMTAADIDDLNQDQMRSANLETLHALGGVEGVAAALKVDLAAGIAAHDELDQAARARLFGVNKYPEPPMDSWLSLLFQAFNDSTLIVLMVAAVVSLVIGLIEEPSHGWIDGAAIVLAVLIVAVVTATNDYEKEVQFRALSSVKDDIYTNVVRDGFQRRVKLCNILVGDVVVLATGDKIPCDGIFIQGHDLKSNESSLTGEPEDVAKDSIQDPFLLSGCSITAGSATMLAIAVGPSSRWGRIKSRLATEAENTALQTKLDVMAKKIGYVGGIAALGTLAAMILAFAVQRQEGYNWVSWLVHSFVMAVTLVVVAVPEGLPLAVTIALAFSTKQMLADHNLIRVLAACETMGNATTICSDKTGTLTQNRMTVVASYFDGKFVNTKGEGSMPPASSMPPQLVNLLLEGMSVNTTAVREIDDETECMITVGSKTEGALLMLVEHLHAGSANGVPHWKTVRGTADIAKQYPFSSARKMMSTLVRTETGHRLYVKGASEIVLSRSRSIMMASGVVDLDSARADEVTAHIGTMARAALRTIGIAHRDFAEGELPEDWQTVAAEDDLVLDGVVGIMDPLREDVKDAVAVCQRAGIMVRMVTGDNIDTAKAIAKQCGILTDGGVAMEGPDFRRLSPAELDRLLPRLQVLARSSPDDKHTLVVRLNGTKLPKTPQEWEEQHPGHTFSEESARSMLPGYRPEWEAARGGKGKAIGEVVGVTGDGTNDAPALKAADVGLSMGKSGTEVAKEASDIVILDDRFSSIKQAVMWGRSVYDNIRKFLQFQLTVNVVALTITFLAAVMGLDPPVNTVMMLWVNLIMNAMGALALGTEAPTEELLSRRPYKRSAALVSRPMWRNILVQAAYQLALLLVLLIAGGASASKQRTTVGGVTSYSLAVEPGTGLFGSLGVIDGSVACLAYGPSGDCIEEDYTHYSFIFNVFVFCQLFNEVNARRINDDWNVFRGIFANWLIMAVIAVSIVLQFLIVTFGGYFTKTAPLSWQLWLWSIALGFVALPLGVLMRFIPVKEDPRAFAGYALPASHATIHVADATVGAAGAGAGAAAAGMA